MAEIVDHNNDDNVDVKLDDEVHSPTHNSPTCQEHSGARHDMDSMDPLDQTGWSFVILDDDCSIEGDSLLLQKEREKRATASLRFFAQSTEFHGPTISPLKFF